MIHFTQQFAVIIHHSPRLPIGPLGGDVQGLIHLFRITVLHTGEAMEEHILHLLELVIHKNCRVSGKKCSHFRGLLLKIDVVHLAICGKTRDKGWSQDEGYSKNCYFDVEKMIRFSKGRIGRVFVDVSFTVSFWSLGFPQKFVHPVMICREMVEVCRLQATGGAEATPHTRRLRAVSATG